MCRKVQAFSICLSGVLPQSISTALGAATAVLTLLIYPNTSLFFHLQEHWQHKNKFPFKFFYHLGQQIIHKVNVMESDEGQEVSCLLELIYSVHQDYLLIVNAPFPVVPLLFVQVFYTATERRNI